MSGTKARQDVAKRGRILQIGRDGTNTIEAAWWAPCEPKHLPAAIAEMAGEIAADNTAGADHKRCVRHRYALLFG
ncbi:hypothetical protein ACVWXN_006335 [Bradyrhizobium sp. i1.4.4]